MWGIKANMRHIIIVVEEEESDIWLEPLHLEIKIILIILFIVVNKNNSNYFIFMRNLLIMVVTTAIARLFVALWTFRHIVVIYIGLWGAATAPSRLNGGPRLWNFNDIISRKFVLIFTGLLYNRLHPRSVESSTLNYPFGTLYLPLNIERNI